MKLLTLIITINILFCSSVLAQTNPQKQRLQLLNQLDQLDKIDLQDALEAANACADREDFSCAEAKIKEAKLLIVDDEDTKAIAQAQSYLSGKITARDQRIAEQQRQAAAARANSSGSIWDVFLGAFGMKVSNGYLVTPTSTISTQALTDAAGQLLGAVGAGNGSGSSTPSSYGESQSGCKVLSLKQTETSRERVEFEGEATERNGKHAIHAFADTAVINTGLVNFEDGYNVYARRNSGINKTSLGNVSLDGKRGSLPASSLRDSIIKGYEMLKTCEY